MLLQPKYKTLLIGINAKYIHPAIGIMNIVSNSKYEVSFKEFTIKDEERNIIDFVNNSDYILIGFSVYIWNVEMIKNIIKEIKNKIIFLAGPEASYDLSLFNLSSDIKYIIKNEGEESFNMLQSYLLEKINLDEISNLYYRKDNDFNFTFDKYPDLKNIKHNLSLIGLNKRIVYLESNRGCPNKCSYCLASLAKPVRFFPLEEVYSNLDYCLSNNVKTVKFLDRNFLTHTLRCESILKYIIKNDNQISTFQFEINIENIKPSTLNIIKMARADLFRFEIGIQSVNDLTNQEILRKQSFNEIKGLIETLSKYATVHLDLIAGLPNENYESFINTFNTVFKLFPAELQLGILKELKGTKLSNEKDKYLYNFSSKAPFEIIRNNCLTPIDLQNIRFVEVGLNTFYNSGNYTKTIKYLFNNLNINPFTLFLEIGKNIVHKNHFQRDQKLALIYSSIEKFSPNKELLFYIMKKDYLIKSNLKPKIYWDKVSKDVKKTVYKKLSILYNLNLDELYRYAHIEIYENEYFIINYKNKKVYEITI